MSTGAVINENPKYMYMHEFSDEVLAELSKDNLLAEEILINRYERMVNTISASYYLQGAEREDIVQEGMVGLWEAIHDYSRSKECSFRSFARMCVTRQIITAVRAYSCQKHNLLNSSISLQDYNRQDDEYGQIINMQDLSVPPLDEQMIAGEQMHQLRHYISTSCSNLERTVLNLFLEGKSYLEISELCNKSTKSIDGALQRVRQKLLVYLADVESN